MLKDQYGRTVDYLRISLTERCNFRCQYCMPEKPFSWVPKEDLLSFEELFEFIKICIDDGVKKIRITGGEPTLREDLDKFIKMIYDYDNSIDLCMTTNGYFLNSIAKNLKDAGLNRINISLDSLKKDVAHKIVGKDVLDNILSGIDKALEVGLKIKVNMVPMLGINDSEILDIFEYCKAKDISIRFIEYMENSFANNSIKGLKSKEVLDLIKTKYIFEPLAKDDTSPAKYFKLNNNYKFGIIEPYEDDFCKSCNRMRLTAEGQLIPCLYYDEGLSIKDSLKKFDIQKTKDILYEMLENKPEKNRWSANDGDISSRAFYETGG
jgi:cyclic pyranopterin phosphate synthase